MSMLHKFRFHFTLFLFFALHNFVVSAQKSAGNSAWTKYRHEVSFGYGFNTLLANLGESDQLGLTFMLQRSTLNANYRYYLKKKIALRGSVSHAYARKNDKKGVEDLLDRAWNMPIDYKTSLSEFAFFGEYHVFDETNLGKRKSRVRRARGGMSKAMNLGLSFFGGPALTYFRPVGEYQGSMVELRPINSNPGTDLNAPDYKRVNFHFPIGTNVRFVFDENLRLGFEFGYRLGVRDYMNNVSAVYYRDGKPAQDYTDFDDPNFAGGYVTFAKEEAPVGILASENGRRNYFFGMFTLAYRIKS